METVVVIEVLPRIDLSTLLRSTPPTAVYLVSRRWFLRTRFL